MDELEILIIDLRRAEYRCGISAGKGDFLEEAEQATQNLVNYIKENYERIER